MIIATIIFSATTMILANCEGGYRFEGEYVGAVDIVCDYEETVKGGVGDVPSAGIYVTINGVTLEDCHLSNIRHNQGPVEIVLWCP